MPKLHIEEKYCKGCGICVEFCPAKILKTSEKDELPGIFSPGERGNGEMQEVRHVLAPLPGLRHRRLRIGPSPIHPRFSEMAPAKEGQFANRP